MASIGLSVQVRARCVGVVACLLLVAVAAVVLAAAAADDDDDVADATTTRVYKRCSSDKPLRCYTIVK